jgi:hypothetical protein
MITTSNVALTEGNKMKLRHFGHALNLFCGALKLFLTCNFADTYCPLTMVLYDEENQECLAERKMNLFESVPAMPTLKDMHKIVAKSPRTQARLFLVMEQLSSPSYCAFKMLTSEQNQYVLRKCQAA